MPEAATVKFDVGGVVYKTARSTLQKFPESMLATMVSDRWAASSSEEAFFVDRDPNRFRYILDFYRDGHIILPITVSKREVLREAEYFGVPVSAADIEVDTADFAEVKRSVLEHEREMAESLDARARETLTKAMAERLACIVVQKMGGATSVCVSSCDADFKDSQLSSTMWTDKVFMETLTQALALVGCKCTHPKFERLHDLSNACSKACYSLKVELM
mmetsp:Transcript_9294/g.28655  ORF Transcript_9294/g.28655 Transcript_9294/m.28655 type:complete len:218 (-) Transcript_9294:87-740(-)